jgi:hypothetical protein
MATDIVQGLFGLTPEAYQAEQNRQAQAEALRFAQLDPFQQANYGLYMGGRQLGGVVGQALGAQDPQLQMISKTQSLLRGINPSDEASIEAGIQEAAQFNPQLAFSLKDTLQNLRLNKSKIEAEAALTEQRLRERQGADPVQQIIRTGKFTTPSIEKYSQTGKISDLDFIDPEDKTALSETKEGIYLINKKTGDKIARIGSSPERGTSVNVGVSTLDKEGNLRKDFGAETKPVSQAITTANRIEKLLNMGSLGEVIAQKQFAKLAGDNNISNRDVDSLSNFGDLGQRLAGTISRFFEGTYSESQRQEALKLVKELKTSGASQYNQIQQQYINRAKAENIPDKTISFIAPDLPSEVRPSAPLPPEGTKLRNKKTGKIEIVQGGKLVPVSE